MPLLARDFQLTPAQSSLALSVSTATLALALLASSSVADRFGRKTVMVASMYGCALLSVLCALVADYTQLVAVRALLGLMLGGLLPPSRHGQARRARGPGFVDGLRIHLRDPGLPWLFALPFLLMGTFVSLYNYIGYRLLAPPFALSQSAVGALSLLYLLGIFSSMWAGKLGDKLGRRNVLWLVMGVMIAGLLVTLHESLFAVVLGVGLATFGFFASHSVASSWVGRRARPPQALASGIYLFFYYLGSSVVGWFSGYVWEQWAWPGVVTVLGAILLAAMLIALRLRGLPPVPLQSAAP